MICSIMDDFISLCSCMILLLTSCFSAIAFIRSLEDKPSNKVTHKIVNNNYLSRFHISTDFHIIETCYSSLSYQSSMSATETRFNQEQFVPPPDLSLLRPRIPGKIGKNWTNAALYIAANPSSAVISSFLVSILQWFAIELDGLQNPCSWG